MLSMMNIYDYLFIVFLFITSVLVFILTSTNLSKKSSRILLVSVFVSISILISFLVFSAKKDKEEKTIIVYNSEKEVVTCYQGLFVIDSRDKVVTLTDKDGNKYYITSHEIK